MECEAIREKTVQDIIKAKTEVHELVWFLITQDFTLTM